MLPKINLLNINLTTYLIDVKFLLIKETQLVN